MLALTCGRRSFLLAIDASAAGNWRSLRCWLTLDGRRKLLLLRLLLTALLLLRFRLSDAATAPSAAVTLVVLHVVSRWADELEFGC